MKSIFTDKHVTPTAEQIKMTLGKTFALWEHLREYTRIQYPAATEEWNFPSEKFGWSFRIKDKKRIMVYLLPRATYFKVALVFGQKATDQIMESDISETIKTDLMAAKVYAEGRGIRIEVRDKSNLEDIQKLIKIKTQK